MVSKEGATGSSSTTQGSAGGAPPSGQAAPSTEGTRQPIPTEKKKESETNKTCRGYHKDPHNGGSMLLRILAEKMDKDGNYINDASQEYGTQMEKIMNEERSKRELQQLENPDLIFEIDVDWDNDEYAQVKGKPKKGRVNAKGHLPKEVIKGNKKSTTNQG
ncbi:hypothetical protein ACFE04_005785 [Oxalis oulophora]